MTRYEDLTTLSIPGSELVVKAGGRPVLRRANGADWCDDLITSYDDATWRTSAESPAHNHAD